MPEILFDSQTADPEAQAAHDAAMAARADAGDLKAPPAEVVKEAAPEWMPAKFARHDDKGKFDLAASSEAMSGGHATLEKQFTQSHQKPAEPVKDPAAEGAGDETGDAAKAALGPEMFGRMADEFAETGVLSEASRLELASKGITNEIVDDYLAGQQSRADTYTKTIYDAAGGEEAYNTMVDWANGQMTEEQAAAFNNAVHGGDTATAELAIQGLQTQMASATGASGVPVGGQPPADTQAAGFASRAEMTRAIGDKRYETDEAYRATVIARIDKTTF